MAEKEKKVAVVVEENKRNCKRIVIPENVVTLQDLQTLIEQTFTDQLVTGSIHYLQMYDKEFDCYINLESLEEIEYRSSKINAVLKVSLINCHNYDFISLACSSQLIHSRHLLFQTVFQRLKNLQRYTIY